MKHIGRLETWKTTRSGNGTRKDHSMKKGGMDQPNVEQQVGSRITSITHPNPNYRTHFRRHGNETRARQMFPSKRDQTVRRTRYAMSTPLYIPDILLVHFPLVTKTYELLSSKQVVADELAGANLNSLFISCHG